MRPKALDLFCGAGGASMGLHRAGFDVVGIDLKRQPRYPFTLIRGDATRPPVNLAAFDFIWASPPCQAHTVMRDMHNAKEHADLIPEVRTMLQASGKPWAIENVVGAPLERSITLCGTMFGLGAAGTELRRHRLFETSFPILAPICQHGSGPVVGIYGGHVRNRRRAPSIQKDRGRPDFPMSIAQEAMGIDWMALSELSQAIPPSYSEFIAKAFLRWSALTSVLEAT